VAQVTTRVRIGLAVSPVYIRTPATIAAAAGTVSQLAPGASSSASARRATPSCRTGTAARSAARDAASETVTAVRGMLAGQKVALGRARRCARRAFRLMVPPAAPVPIYIGALRRRCSSWRARSATASR
jgi:alkanesulfonate monooxygenase SsuD/methylene tetrahydromethanopterin reductase-like flavin-dependent oxidoreductase (luciferase family)